MADFIENEKMQESGQKWAKGLEPNPAMGVQTTEFEKKAKELGLKPSQYATSKKLKQWCVSDIDGNPRYNVLYVPEALLKTWDIRTMWDGEEGEESLIPLTPFSDMIGTDYALNSEKK